MDDKDIVIRLLEYFEPDATTNSGFMRYVADHCDDYFDYYFLGELHDSLKWKREELTEKAQNDYIFLSDDTHPVSLHVETKELCFGQYIVPAYWYKDEMPDVEIEKTILRYKRIWEKRDFGEICFPLLQDWYPIERWRKSYRESFLQKMEFDLEAGNSKEASRLYYLYAKHAGIYEIDRYYLDKIKQILSIENRTNTEKGFTADLRILLWNDEKCFVRVKAGPDGKYHSTTALRDDRFTLFTDKDAELIQETVFDNHKSPG